MEPTARQRSHRVDGECVETPARDHIALGVGPECEDEAAGRPAGGVCAQLEGSAERFQVISTALELSCLCLAWIPGEGSIVQPEVGCVFILPNLLKDLAGRGSRIPEPEPRGPSFQEEPATWGPVVQPARAFRVCRRPLRFAFESSSQLACLTTGLFPFQRKEKLECKT